MTNRTVGSVSPSVERFIEGYNHVTGEVCLLLTSQYLIALQPHFSRYLTVQYFFSSFLTKTARTKSTDITC